MSVPHLRGSLIQRIQLSSMSVAVTTHCGGIRTMQVTVQTVDMQRCHGEEELRVEVVLPPHPAAEARRSVRVEHLQAQSCRHNKPNSPCRDGGTLSERAN